MNLFGGGGGGGLNYCRSGDGLACPLPFITNTHTHTQTHTQLADHSEVAFQKINVNINSWYNFSLSTLVCQIPIGQQSFI